MVSETTKKFREPLAFGLLAVAALYVISGLSVLFKSRDDLGYDFTQRAALVGHVFADPVLVISLAAAVLLVVAGGQASRNAKTVVLIALVIGAVSLVFAVVSWLAGLSADGIRAYGGVTGAGRVVGTFLGLAQVGFLALAVAYAASVLQSFPRTVKAQQTWGAGQPGWGQPQQPWGQPSQQPWSQQPQQPWGQPQTYQSWPEPAQPPQPAPQSWAQQPWGQQPGAHQSWTPPPQQPTWGEAPGSTPPPGSGWGAPQSGPAQPSQPTWDQPTSQPVWGPPAEPEPAHADWSQAGRPAEPEPAHADWSQAEGAESSWTGSADPAAAADDALAADEPTSDAAQDQPTDAETSLWESGTAVSEEPVANEGPVANDNAVVNDNAVPEENAVDSGNSDDSEDSGQSGSGQDPDQSGWWRPGSP